MTLKVFAICFHGPMFGKIGTKLLLIPAKETPRMGSKQCDYPITAFQMASKRDFPDIYLKR